MSLGLLGVHPEPVDHKGKGPGLVLDGQVRVLGALKVGDARLSGQLDGGQVPVTETPQEDRGGVVANVGTHRTWNKDVKGKFLLEIPKTRDKTRVFFGRFEKNSSLKKLKTKAKSTKTQAKIPKKKPSKTANYLSLVGAKFSNTTIFCLSTIQFFADFIKALVET